MAVMTPPVSVTGPLNTEVPACVGRDSSWRWGVSGDGEKIPESSRVIFRRGSFPFLLSMLPLWSTVLVRNIPAILIHKSLQWQIHKLYESNIGFRRNSEK